MAGLALSAAGYRNLVRMSTRSFLLVEGRDDKIAFRLLLDGRWDPEPTIRVHSAEDLEDGALSGLGNRERVEQITASIEGSEYAPRYVGFVDRQFRGFEIGEQLVDQVGGHKVVGRLVWSRGHSIENYYFDFARLRRPLRTLAPTEYFATALDLLSERFQSVVRLACALSLAAKECDNRLSLVKKSVDWTVLRIDGGQMQVDYDAWSRRLTRDHHYPPGDAEALVSSLKRWLGVVETADETVVRWLCHGHIGLSVLWAAYGRCVCAACEGEERSDGLHQARRVLKGDESVRFHACAEEWAAQALGVDPDLYPSVVFKLLDP